MLTQRIAGLGIWIIQGAWYSSQPDPGTPLVVLWIVMVLAGAGLMFGPRLDKA
jgi:hypothetical protein